MRNEVSAQRMLTAIIAAIFDSGDRFVLDGSFCEQIGPFIELESQAAKSPEQLAQELGGAKDLLDFGCGTADHRPMLESFGYRWSGVNYRAGMAREAAQRSNEDPAISFYDGLILPYEDASFDLVYSFQVFEHIQRPDVTFSEIRRVLRPGGALIGAVSYLEQIHDYSTFNFTPYGFKVACDQGGLEVRKIYPRFDAFSWLLYRLLVVTSATDENSINPSLSPNNEIHRLFEAYGRKMGRPDKEINLMRLMFCSHYTFHAVRECAIELAPDFGTNGVV